MSFMSFEQFVSGTRNILWNINWKAHGNSFPFAEQLNKKSFPYQILEVVRYGSYTSYTFNNGNVKTFILNPNRTFETDFVDLLAERNITYCEDLVDFYEAVIAYEMKDIYIGTLIEKSESGQRYAATYRIYTVENGKIV